MTQKSKIAVIIAILVIVAGIGIVLAADVGGLQGLIFKPIKLSKIAIDYKKQLPPCTKLIIPKISYPYIDYVKPNDGYFDITWFIKGLCGTAKVDLYTYTGEALVYSVEANIKPNYIKQNSAGDGLFYYTFSGKYAGDLGPMAYCIVGKPCMVRAASGIGVDYYSTEAKTYTNFFPVINNRPDLKRYFLIRISDQDGNELGRSDIVAIYNEKIPSISSFYPVGLNNGNNFKLKWSVKNMFSGYQLQLRVYTADILAYTAEANKTTRPIPNTFNLSYYTIESSFAPMLFTPPLSLKVTSIYPYSSETGPLSFNLSSQLKYYFALSVKKNNIDYPVNFSPVLAILMSSISNSSPPPSSVPPTLPTTPIVPIPILNK